MDRFKLIQISLAAIVAAIAFGCSPATTPDNSGGDSATKTDQAKPAATDNVATNPGAPSGGPAASGGQRGGQRGGGFRRGPSVLFLLNNDSVKKEIKLTDDQSKTIEGMMPQRGQRGQASQGSGDQQQMTQEERQKQREELEAKVLKTLKPDQSKRLMQIFYQVAGARALSRPEVVKELKITKDEATKIEEALQPPQQTGGQAPGGGGMDRAAMQKAREEANKKAVEVLTTSQQKKWTEMQGEHFDIQFPQRSGGAGGAAVAK